MLTATIRLKIPESFLVKAIKGALGDKKSIKRFGNFFLPMDETLVMCAIDLSGRPYLVYDLNLTTERVGYFLIHRW